MNGLFFCAGCRPPFKVPFLFRTSGISQPSRIGQLGGEFHLKASFLIWIWHTCDHPWFGHQCTPHLIHWELASPLNGPGDLLDVWLLWSLSSKYFGSAFFVSLSVNGIIVGGSRTFEWQSGGHLLYKVRVTSKFGYKCSNAPQFVYNATATCRYICLCLSAVVPTLLKLFVLLEIHTYHREEDVSLRIRYKEISVQIKCKNSVRMFSGTWKWV